MPILRGGQPSKMIQPNGRAGGLLLVPVLSTSQSLSPVIKTDDPVSASEETEATLPNALLHPSRFLKKVQR